MLQEDYDSLTTKTLRFLRTAVTAWDPEYVVKVTLLKCFTALWQPLHRSPWGVVKQRE